MAEQKNNKLIVVLAAVFLAVVVVAGVVFFLIPDDGRQEADPGDVPIGAQPATTVSAAAGFQLTVLQRRLYLSLNRQLVQEGALPVQPPAVVGKPNPFL